MFPVVVFGMINPLVVIVTTPNAEFNVLFPNFTGFRHPDHKFEWTRAQFQDWYVVMICLGSLLLMKGANASRQ